MPKDNYGFYMPVKLIFRKGALEETAKEAVKYGKKVLIVTDKPLYETGLLDSVILELKKLQMEYKIWSDIIPNPRDTDIDKGATYAIQFGAEVIVAVGGGSSMDTAKAIAAIMTNGGKAKDWYGNKLVKPIVPLICVPTTCGTGSEVTHESIVNDTEKLIKACIWGPLVSAKVAILDPCVLKGLPKKLLASTGIDALTHAVEAYTCTAASPITDALAIKAVELIGKSLKEAVERKDEDALSDMMSASVIAGMAFGNSNVAAVHCMAEALGGFYDIPHGVANAMLLPVVSRYNVSGAASKYADIARALKVEVEGMTDEEAAYKGIDYIEDLCEQLEIPKFYELAVVNPKDFEYLAGAAEVKGPTKVNPVPIDKDKYIELFQKAYEH